MRPVFTSGISVVVLLAGSALTAEAVPLTNGQFVNTANQCDSHDITLTHELGIGSEKFPGQEIEVINAPSRVHQAICTKNPLTTGAVVDQEVTIENKSGVSWVDLFFVADDVTGLVMIANADGMINRGLAFRIDNIGDNQPLLSESITADLIFEPGEQWTFVIEYWRTGSHVLFNSPNNVGEVWTTDTSSLSSIVANPLATAPEPATVALLTLGLAGIGYQRRRKAFSS